MIYYHYQIHSSLPIFLYEIAIVWCFVLLNFWDRYSLYSPGCPGTHSVDHAGLEIRNLLASASQVLGLKACATTAQLKQPYSELHFNFWCHELHRPILYFHSMRNELVFGWDYTMYHFVLNKNNKKEYIGINLFFFLFGLSRPCG